MVSIDSSAQESCRRISVIERLQITLIGLYMAIAGIFWFPAISAQLLSAAKMALFSGIFALAIFLGIAPNTATRRLVLALLVGSLCIFISNLITTSTAVAIHAARDLLEPAIWLVALSSIRVCAYNLTIRYFIYATVFFLVISLYPVGVVMGLLPELYPPVDYLDIPLDAPAGYGSVVADGFSGSRTGWGVIVSFNTLFLTVWLLSTNRVSQRILGLFVFFVGLASIVVTGARGGAVAMILSIAYFSLRRIRLNKLPKYIMMAPIIAGFALGGFQVVSNLAPERYLRGFSDNGSVYEKINAATSGRLDSIIVPIERFVTSPFFGLGADGGAKVTVSTNGHAIDPHSAIVRILYESGIVGFIPVCVVCALLLSAVVGFRGRARRWGSEQGVNRWYLMRDFSPVVIAGFILAFAEPRVIFGTFNTNMVFWTTIWVLLQQRNFGRSLATVGRHRLGPDA